MVGFQIKDRKVRFTITYPKQAHRPTRHRGRFNPEEAIAQERRRLWRALTLVVKAKLESVESKVETFDQAFLAHIVMPDGRTIAEHLAPEIANILAGGRTGPLLLMAGNPDGGHA
jgi:hypothetical protein